MSTNKPRKDAKNFMVLEFLSLSTNTNVACTAITAFAKQMNPTPNAISNITTSVREAVENAIIHAYPDALGTISIMATIFNDDTIEIKVKDLGLGIENVEKARKPLFTTRGGDCSGMGFTIMESFMTTLNVCSTPGKGTIVTMTYLISQK